MSIQNLQQALTQMRANGASDIEIQLVIERFKNNAIAKQNNFKEQFAAQVAQPISEKVNLSAYAERKRLFEAEAEKRSEVGKQIVSTQTTKLDYLQNYHKNNTIPTTFPEGSEIPIVQLDKIQDPQAKAFHEEKQKDETMYWDAKSSTYQDKKEFIKNNNKEREAEQKRVDTVNDENVKIQNREFVPINLDNYNTFLGKNADNVANVLKNNSLFSDLNATPLGKHALEVTYPGGKEIIDLENMELNSDAVQQLTNIKNWYAENKLKHPGVFGIFNEISVYDGVRYYDKRKDLPNLNKILGQVGYKIEHESSGAHDTTYNITDINGKIIAGDIPVTEIATWVDQNLDDKQKEEISDSFTKEKIAYEA